MKEKKPVVVIVPIYQSSLDDFARASLVQTTRILKDHPIVGLIPRGLDISSLQEDFPTLAWQEVSDEWLGKKNGIAGYNRMMLSAAFYDLFAEYEYLLVCHTDAWVFRDELLEWCGKGYDCVAAPWIRRKVYNLPVVRQYMQYRMKKGRDQGRVIRQMLYGKVGNGGFSLRRIARFSEACDRYRSEIGEYTSLGSHLGNEDVFWAIVPEGFRYPAQQEALRFAFDTNPRYCYNLCGGRLPMGCHAWSKPRMYRFWKEIIPLPGDCAAGTDR